MTRNRSATSLAALLLLLTPLAGCATEQEKYCEAVKDHQNCLLYTSPSPRD